MRLMRKIAFLVMGTLTILNMVGTVDAFRLSGIRQSRQSAWRQVPLAAPVASQPAAVALAQVSNVRISGTGVLWGVNSGNDIWVRSGITTQSPKGSEWKQIPGKMKHVAVSPDGLSVWGISDQDHQGGAERKHFAIYFREGVSAENPVGISWTQVTGGLAQISVGKDGYVWGVNGDGQIYIRTDVTPANRKGSAWRNIEGGLKHVSIGPDGQVWGVNNAGNIYFRDGVTSSALGGTGWSQISGGLKQISVGPGGACWGVNHSDNIWARTGVTPANPKGTDWRQIPGGLKYVSMNPQGQVWGANAGDQIWFRNNVTTSGIGTDWEGIDLSFARLKQLEAGPLVFDGLGLKAGDKIAIYSHKSGKYLQVADGKFLKATGNSPGDRGCTFIVLRDGNKIGFKSPESGNNNLQSVPGSYEVKFENQNFLAWEYWFIEQEGSDAVYLKNTTTNGYMSVRDAGEGWSQGGKVWTRNHTGGPSSKGPYEKFKIEIVPTGIAVGIAAGVAAAEAKAAAERAIAMRVAAEAKAAAEIAAAVAKAAAEKAAAATMWQKAAAQKAAADAKAAAEKAAAVALAAKLAAEKAAAEKAMAEKFAAEKAVVLSKAGLVEFTHEGRLLGLAHTFHENWKFAEAGNGYGIVEISSDVSRDTKDYRDAYIAISPEAKMVPDKSLVLWLGTWGNELTEIRDAIYVSGFDNIKAVSIIRDDINNDTVKGARAHIKIVTNPNAVLTKGVDTYWFRMYPKKAEGKEVTAFEWGKGAEVGKGPLQSVVLPYRHTGKYVGFGGYTSNNITFSKIRLSGKEPANLPSGWIRMVGEPHQLSAGSDADGYLLGLMLEKDGEVQKWNPNSETDDPWDLFKTEQSAGVSVGEVVNIAASDLNEILVLTKDGQAWKYNNATKLFVKHGPVLAGLDKIAAGKDLWACNSTTKTIYRFDAAKNTWQEMKDQNDKGGIDVSTSIDGTVYKVTENLIVRVMTSDTNWEKIKKDDGDDLLANNVAVSKKGYALATYDRPDNDVNELYEIVNNVAKPMLGTDGKPATGPEEITINSVGSGLSSDDDGTVMWRFGYKGYIQPPAPAAPGKPAVAAKAPPAAPKQEVLAKSGQLKKATPAQKQAKQKAKKGKPAKKLSKKASPKKQAAKKIKAAKKVAPKKVAKKVAPKKGATKKLQPKPKATQSPKQQAKKH